MDVIKENKMGTQAIPSLLSSMALPMMFSMLVQALYNIVDSMYVARLGENALTALALAFSIQMILVAVTVGSSVGVNALLARRLGEKNPQGASKVAVNGLFCGVICSIIFAIFGLFGVETYFRQFSDDATLIAMGTSYTSICTIFSIGGISAIMSERIIQATGKTVYSMYAQTTGAITNIILDPIFIFGWFGVPAMGVAGAAIATIIGQFCALAVITYFNITKNREISLSFRGFKPDFKVIKEIYKIGIPVIIMQSIGSIMTVSLNSILIGFSATAVSVFGLYFKLQSFIFMPIFGLTSAMIPIISFNYGSGSKERILTTIKMSAAAAITLMIFGTIIFQTQGGWMLATFFKASPEMLAIGIPALQILSLGFVPASIAIVISCSLQALGFAVYGMILSIFRQLVILIPIAWVLGTLYGLPALWFSFPIAELGCVMLAVIFFIKTYERTVKHLE